MTTSIFIKTCLRDLPWLYYCLKSIAKFCSGYQSVFVIGDSDCNGKLPVVDGVAVNYVTLPLEGNGYFWQQLVKMRADLLSRSNPNQILFVDSDCIFTAPNTPESFMRDGKPLMLITPFAELGDKVPWQKPTEDALGWPCEFEGMRRLPLLYDSYTLAQCRTHLEQRHAMPLKDYVMSRKVFSEFNVLTNYALHTHPSMYSWCDTSKEPLPPTLMRQFRSYDGITEDTLKEMEALGL